MKISLKFEIDCRRSQPPCRSTCILGLMPYESNRFVTMSQVFFYVINVNATFLGYGLYYSLNFNKCYK